MPYCNNCGQFIERNEYICPECNYRIKSSYEATNKFNIGFYLLGLFVPMAGLILFLIWMKERPGDARSSLYGLLTYGVLFVGYFLFIFITIFTQL